MEATKRPEASTLSYIPELDAIRALSVLAVVAVHTIPKYVPNGGYGVDMFFVLSGFLITRLLLREWMDRGAIDFVRFYGRRIARLTPALWLMIAVFSVVMLAQGQAVWEVLSAAAGAGFYLMNFMRAYGFGHQGLFGHTWSLAVEEQFYLIWPLALVLMLRHLGRSRTTVLVLVLILLFVLWTSFIYATDVHREGSRFDGFDVHVHTLLMGCFLALGGWTDRKTMVSRWWPVPAVLFALRIVGVVPGFVFWLDVAVWDVAAALTLLGLVAHSGSRALAILRIPPMLYLGKVSYGMYLWHFPMISLIGGYVGGLKLFAATWILSLVAATLSYYGVETRFHRRAVKAG